MLSPLFVVGLVLCFLGGMIGGALLAVGLADRVARAVIREWLRA